jgi:hypothetical protein
LVQVAPPVNKFKANDFCNMEIEVHNFEKKVNYYLQRIEKDGEILRENKELLKEFVKGLRKDGISWATIYKYI